MLIDSHCHLDAHALVNKSELIQRAVDVGVKFIIVPAVEKANFHSVIKLAQEYPQVVYTLGIHPMYVQQAQLSDLEDLALLVEHCLSDPQFVGIGEIGLDFFIQSIAEGAAREKQEFFLNEQLKLAKKNQLPVLLHVRKSQDNVLKYLRQNNVHLGIAHAFNGSDQQAENYIKQGFVLGFGGAMTYPLAKQLRRLAANLPLESIVLETDSPDLAPAWLGSRQALNTPEQTAGIAQVLSELCHQTLSEVVEVTGQNVLRQIPRLLSYIKYKTQSLG